jgi:hypothetical protein
MAERRLERVYLPLQAAAGDAREAQAACGEVLAEPGGLRQAKFGHRVVVAREVGLGVAHQVQVWHAAAWRARGAQFNLSRPACRRA